MNDFFRNNNTNDDGFDWGSPGGVTFHKWLQVGQVLEGKVTKRGFHVFNEGDEPVRQLHLDTAHGPVVLTVSQVDLRNKMAAANVEVDDSIRITYLGEERATKGLRKTFKLEVLSKAGATAA